MHNNKSTTATFPEAYSNFAISVDSREAERTPPTYTTSTSSSTTLPQIPESCSSSSDSIIPSSGILRQPRSLHSTQSSIDIKRRELSPKTYDRERERQNDRHKGEYDRERGKYGVRFSKEVDYDYGAVPSALHHRRSSTAAFVEYVRAHLADGVNHRPNLALTPKRALLLFVIVFSATYLALGLMPLVSNITGIGSPVTVVVKRGHGYYGNSHIFRGGENLADPHLSGDEHDHYSQQDLGTEENDNTHDVKLALPDHGGTSAKSSRRQKPLRTFTLAEQATLEEIKVARAKARAEALELVQHLRDGNEHDFGKERNIEGSAQEAGLGVVRKRPMQMPQKLNRLKAQNAISEALAKESGSPQGSRLGKPQHKEAADNGLHIDHRYESATRESEISEDDEDLELEETIARLRKEALDRRLNKVYRAQEEGRRANKRAALSR